MITLLHAQAGRWPFCSEILRIRTPVRPRFPARQAACAKGDFAMANPEGQGNDAAKTQPRRTSASIRKAPARSRLISRLWITAERQVEAIEARLSELGNDAQAIERDAKTLAIVSRTVRELVAIEAEAKSARQKAEKPRDDAPSRSIDDFRAELAARLEQLRREGEGRSDP